MAVTLSPLGGVAGQFFDNNGAPLSGGLLYTYAAGTTTAQATYYDASGVILNANPIVLDAGGRVPNEIWLNSGLSYKFVLKTSAGVLIGSWDNITGINSNFVNYNAQEQIQTATAGQTVFTLTGGLTYTPGTNTLQVFVDGVNQYDGSSYSYTETNSTTVTFTQGLHVGALVKFTTAVTLSAGVTTSNLVSYQPAGTGAVATTVQAKLRQTVSVMDFGATGNGTTDDTAAIQAAITAVNAAGGGTVFIPHGEYKISSTLNLLRGVVLSGQGGFDYSAYPTIYGAAIIPASVFTGTVVISCNAGYDNTTILSGVAVQNIGIDCTNISTAGFTILNIASASNCGPFNNIIIYNCDDNVCLKTGSETAIANPNAADGLVFNSFFTYSKTVGYVNTNPRAIISSNSNEISFRDCKFQSKANGTGGIAVQVYQGSNAITFDACSFAGCATGILIFNSDATGTAAAPSWIRVRNSTFEGYNIGIYVDSASANAISWPTRLFFDANRFITPIGSNCVNLYVNRGINIEATLDEYIGSGSGNQVFNITSAAQACVIRCNPSLGTNSSVTSVVYGRQNNSNQFGATLFYRQPTQFPTLLNSWVNGSPSNRTVAGYWKDIMGVVHLQGYLNGGTYGSGSGNIIFTLPSGYYPVNGSQFAVPTNGGYGMVIVDNAGNVYASSGSGYLTLDGIVFATS